VPAVLVAAVVAAFSPALGNGFVNWDDDLNLTENPSYRGLDLAHLRWMFTVLHGGHYQPLTWVSYAIDYRLWGLAPFGYHLTSLLLHAATAVAFYLLLRELLRADRAPGPGDDPVVLLSAAAGALFFAIHPLRVESVAWASERRDVLSGLFLLLSLLAYVRAHAGDPARRPARLLAALGWFGLSLLAKAWAITLPAVLLVLDAYPLRRIGLGRGASAWRAIAEKVPFALVAGAAAALALLAQHVEAMRTLAQHGLVARGAQAAYGLCFYAWKTLLPVHLSPLYLLEMPLVPTEPRYAGAVLVVAVVTTVLFWQRRRVPWLAAAVACYVIIVSPVLGFVQSGQQKVADRYTYLACLPFAVLVALGVRRLGTAWAAGRLSAGTRRGATAAAAAVLLALGVLTARQTRLWRDSQTLWTHALTLDGANYVAYTNRGVARQLAGDLAGAAADYDAALAANPGHAEAYKDRGTLREARGDVDGAIADYDAALRFKPTYADAYLCRAVARGTKGNVDGAIADYSAAVRLDPGHARAYYGRGHLRQLRGDLAGAIADYSEALRLVPDYLEAWNNRGFARGALGDRAGAAADLARALELAPPGSPGRELIERNLAGLRGESGG